MRRLDYTIPPEEAGTPVGVLLRRRMGLSGRVVRRIKWLEDGILLDGVRVTTRAAGRPGQVLSARLSDPERRSGLVPAPGPLDIVYEDEDVLVLNKQPGVAVHPSSGKKENTIGNFLLHYYDSKGIEADFHPVHRLDRGTSGLMIVAKHPHAQEVLRLALHTPDFRREYLAVCDGRPQPAAGVIDAPIAHAPDSPIRHCVDPAGLPARTAYETLLSAGGRSLVRLVLSTGRTHQIRVHMAALGCPLTGDFLYGREAPELIPRPALHSAALAFRQPVTGRLLRFTVPLPQDMRALLPADFEREVSL